MTVAPSASPEKVPVIASLPSLSIRVKVCPGVNVPVGVTSRVAPLTFTAPVMERRSLVLLVPSTVTAKVVPALKVRFPVAIVSILLTPGEIVPPLVVKLPAIVPLPERVSPVPKLRIEPDKLPPLRVKSSVLVPPVKLAKLLKEAVPNVPLLAPVTVQVLAEFDPIKVSLLSVPPLKLMVVPLTVPESCSVAPFVLLSPSTVTLRAPVALILLRVNELTSTMLTFLPDKTETLLKSLPG